MADVGKVYPTDVHLLRKELEVQGELLAHEKQEREAVIDQLRLELKTLKRILAEMVPGFENKFERLYRQESQALDPDLRQQSGAV